MNARKTLATWLLLMLGACAAGQQATVEDTSVTGTARAASDERAAEIDLQLRETTLSFDAQSRLTITRRTVYRIMSGEPSEEWKTLSAAWKPGADAPPKLEARVIAADGTVVALDARTQLDSPMASDVPNVFTDRKLRKAPLPAIGPGALVDATVITQELKTATPYGAAVSWGLVTFTPIKSDRLIIEYPASLSVKAGVQHVAALERSESGGVVRLSLERKDVKSFGGVENYTPASRIELPRVVVATGASWNAVAKGYGASIQSRLVLSDALKKTAHEVAGSEKTSAAKATRLLRWLREKVRYTGLEMEDSGLIPFSPDEVVNRRYGDCKDMSALLASMLREVGVPANLALLSASFLPDVQPDLPGVGVFNHAIVFVPGGKGLWIDPTDTFAAPGHLGATTQGRLSLVIDDATAALVRTSEMTAAENKLKVNIEITLARFGAGKVVRVRETTGLALQQRRAIAFENPDNYSTMMAKVARESFATRGQPIISTSKPLELDRPFTERMELPDTNAAHTEVLDATARVDLSGLVEALPIELEDLDDKSVKSDEEVQSARRKSPMQLPQPFTAEIVIRAIPPPGYVMPKLPEAIDAKAGPAKFTMRATQDAQGAVTMKVSLVSPRDYTAEEVEALERELPELISRVPHLTFENQPLALADKGKLAEAVEKARAVLAKEPNEAMAHVTMSSLLLKAHAGTAARKEARRAVELAPNSPIAHRTLGNVSLHNTLGTWLTKGFDRATAITALTRSLELDPEDSFTRTNLIDAHLMNDEGQFNGRGANFLAALPHLEAYRQKHGTNLDNIYAQTLFRAGRHAQLDTLAPKLALTTHGLAAWAASATVLKGPSAGVAVLRHVPEADALEFGKSMSTLMISARKYREFAAVTEAMIVEGGERLTEQQKGYFTLMKQLKPVEQLKYAANDPRSLVVGLARAMFLGEDPGALKLVDTTTPDVFRVKYFTELKKVTRVVEEQGMSREAGQDLFVAMIEVKREKRLPVGELILLTSPLTPQHPIRIIATQQAGGWRIHPATWNNDAAADAIAQALARNNEEEARAMVRAVLQIRPSQLTDKLLNNALVGSPNDLKLSIAALHGFGGRSGEAIAPLEAALKASGGRDHATRMSLALGLGNSLELQQKWLDLEKFSAMCAADTNLAEIAPVFRGVALRHLKRFTEARMALEKDLARMPDDARLLTSLASVARQEGRFDLALKAGLRLVELNKMPAENLAEIAFDAMNTRVDAKAVERAETARKIAEKDPNVLATLAVLYAEVGRVDDAHEVLNIRLEGVEEGNLGNRSWFALGRLAESLSLTEVALDAYQHVKAGEGGEVDPLHTLAQKRLGALGSRKRAA